MGITIFKTFFFKIVNLLKVTILISVFNYQTLCVIINLNAGLLNNRTIKTLSDKGHS